MSKKGRKKIEMTKDKNTILEEAEEKIKSEFGKMINLEETNSIIPYELYKTSKSSNQFNKEMYKMINIYIHKIRNSNNDKYNNIKEYMNNKNNNFKKDLKKIISFFNMNGNELSLLTILLELIKFENSKDLYFIGILCMKCATDNYQNINDEEFNAWFDNIKDIYYNKIKLLDIKDINDRYEELLTNDEDINPEENIDYNKLVKNIINSYRQYNQN